MKPRLQVGFIYFALLTAQTAFSQAKNEEQVKVVTVCDILSDQAGFNGKTLAVLGRYDATDEGIWLSEDDCGRKADANEIGSHAFVWVEQRGSSPTKTSGTPTLDQDSLKMKLAQIEKTTKLEKRPQYQCTAYVKDGKISKAECGWPEVQDRWGIAYGQVETAGNRDVRFGHLGGAAAQVLLRSALIFVETRLHSEIRGGTITSNPR